MNPARTSGCGCVWRFARRSRRGDMVAVSALRSALAAIGNAEAVDPGPAVTVTADNPHVAGAVAGPGAGQGPACAAERGEIDQVLHAEISEREARCANTSAWAGRAGGAASERGGRSAVGSGGQGSVACPGHTAGRSSPPTLTGSVRGCC